MPNTAIFWIRDGVLIDRMAVNALAFAFACLHTQASDGASATLLDFVNFAFEVSGISCAEKVSRWNAVHTPVVSDVEATVDFYNKLVAEAEPYCQYFAGTKQLLEKTQELQCLNFITSAVDQEILDEWGKSKQASHILPTLTEILGHRSSEITKGRGHFKYVFENFDVDRIIYIADAVAEIADGHKNSDEFAITTIGFANVISADAVARAFDVVLDAFMAIAELPDDDLSNFTLEFAKLNLPNQITLEGALAGAGATHIVSGPADDLMGNLNLLLARKIL